MLISEKNIYLLSLISIALLLVLGLSLTTGMDDIFASKFPSKTIQNIKNLTLYGRNTKNEKYVLNAQSAVSLNTNLTFNEIHTTLEMNNGDVINITSKQGETINDDIKLYNKVSLLSSQGHKVLTDNININRISQNLHCDSKVKVDSKYGKITANNCFVQGNKRALQFNNGVKTVIDNTIITNE